MAIEVSTWAELTAAVNNSLSSWGGTVIQLTADIDMNSEAPEGVHFVSNSIGSYITGTLTIDGQGHKIQNLRTPISSAGDIFYLQSSLSSAKNVGMIWQNIDFVNIILAGGSFFNWNSGKINMNLQLNNCRFVGSRSGSAYLIGTTPLQGTSHEATFTSCFFDIPWQGAGVSDLSCTSLIPKYDNSVSKVTANYCWFREKYTGWVWYGGSTTTAYSYNAAYPRFFSFSYMKINGCYIDGKAQLPTMVNYDGYGAFMGYFLHRNIVQNYTPSTQNVFDVEITTDKMTSLYWQANAVYYSSISGVVKKDATADGESCTWVDYRSYADGGVSYPNPILATPAQMKDAAWLSSQGFDIIVPED